MKDHVKKVVMLRRIWGISTSTVCLLLAISIPAPALAAEPEPIDEIVERGLMDDRPQAPMPQEESVTSAGLAGVVPVAIVPRSESTLQNAAEAGVRTAVEDHHSFVSVEDEAGTSSTYVVLEDEGSPNSFQFEIGTIEQTLSLQSDGSILVSDDIGNLVNVIAPPWAVDETGVELPTHYEVRGNVVTQHVNTSGAVFPVVADPTSECGFGWCSVYFNRRETSTLAGGGAAAGGVLVSACAFGGPLAGALCAVGVGAVTGMASLAYNQGDCLGIHVNPAGYTPFFEPRRTSHCR